MGTPLMTTFKLKYIQSFTDKTGRRRHYFRRRGRTSPLPGLPGSHEFMGAYLARTAMGDDHVAVTLFDTTQDVSTFANDPSSFYAGGNMVVDLPGNSILQVGGQVFFGDGGMSGYEGTFSVDARF